MLFTELFPCKEKIFVGAGSWQKGFLLLQHSIFCGRETNDNFFGRIFPCMSRLRYVSPLGSCHTSKIELLERYILIRIWIKLVRLLFEAEGNNGDFPLSRINFPFSFLYYSSISLLSITWIVLQLVLEETVLGPVVTSFTPTSSKSAASSLSISKQGFSTG